MTGKSKVTLSDNSLKVCNSRYFLEDGSEDWEKCSVRSGTAMGSIEKDKSYIDKFSEMIYYQDFIPAGRILRNSGRPKGTLLNCYVQGIDDSIEQIGEFLKNALILWSEGGGVGCNFSSLRPKNDDIQGKGGKSSGLVSFLKAADHLGDTIESGGQRRAAGLCCVDVAHPEVIDFINAKLIDKVLSHFNISVLINEDFLKTVESNGIWTFKFKHRNYHSMSAREIWNLIVVNMLEKAEPGLLNSSNLFKNNSYYFDPIVATNPCITGETLVAVADGRNSVSIKQLTEEGKDVPVYCINLEGVPVIRTMRNPRITGYNQPIYRVTLDDCSTFECTGNHKVRLKNGEFSEVKDLKENDSLYIFSKVQYKNNHNMYWGVGSCEVPEHRMIAAFHNNIDIIPSNLDIHHLDENSLNNDPKNLKIVTKSQHNKHHAHLTVGDKNGNFSGYSNDDIKEHAKILTKNIGRRASQSEWNIYAKEHGLPTKFSNWRKELGGTTPTTLLKWAAIELNYENVDCDPRTLRLYKKLLNEGYNCIIEDSEVYIIKNCEECGEYLKLHHSKREVSFHKNCFMKSTWKRNKEAMMRGREKTNQKNADKHIILAEKQIKVYVDLKSKIGRNPMKKEWIIECKSLGISSEVCRKSSPFQTWDLLLNSAENYNHRVVKVEIVRNDTVYNGTVDEFHNFMIGGFTTSDRGKLQYICNMQCGEAPLGKNNSCCLGSLVLPNFITGKTNTNWKKLQQTVRLAVRFLDNVLDVNRYTLKDIEISAQNSRRIGLGYMGLAEYLFAKEARYGSEKAIFEVERLVRFIRDTAYEASVELAMEKGSFPKFDPVQYGNASFVRKLPVELRTSIKRSGIRNVTLLACAPNGTISLIPEVTSGIEPLLFKAYERRDAVGTRTYVHPMYKKLLLSGEKTPDWFVDAGDLTAKDHLETQRIIQKYVDGSVSKTINFPKGTTFDELSEVLLQYIYDLKGVTVYVDGSREGQVYNRISEEDVTEYLLNESLKVSNSLESSDQKCEICPDEKSSE